MTEVRTSVHFTCQRCLQPLKFHDTMSQLTDTVVAGLSVPVLQPAVVDIDSEISSLDHFSLGFRLTDSKTGSNGFTLVDEKGVPDNLSRQVLRVAGLFEVLSATSEVDHPLCEECTDSLMELLNQQLQFAEEEFKDYSAFLRSCENEVEFENVEQLQRELDLLKIKEDGLILELQQLQAEELEINRRLQEEEREKERLDREEERYWKEYSHYRRNLMIAESESRSLDCQHEYTQAQLLRLKKTNAFNATFHIWHSGKHFGTINNFRLGRLPTAPVDWNEVNAAWGQTALLLNALARQIGLTFKRFRLVPYGNHSFIEVLADRQELPLYGSGGVLYMWDPKFDKGMVAFLDCFEQFKEEMEKLNGEFRLPYRMVPGKIEDPATSLSLSIKMRLSRIQFNSEEQWTKALKFLLTNLKWALAWVSSQFMREEEFAEKA